MPDLELHWENISSKDGTIMLEGIVLYHSITEISNYN